MSLLNGINKTMLLGSGIGSEKSNVKNIYDKETMQNNAEARRQVAYASLPGLLANPSGGNQSQTAGFVG